MKITLSFPANGDNKRPEKEVDVEIIPRKGELVSWNDSPNFEVEDVIHDFSDDNENAPRVVVWLCQEPPA